jgi:hypothetical protein
LVAGGGGNEIARRRDACKPVAGSPVEEDLRRHFF